MIVAAILKPGTLVQEYKIIELAGDGSQSNVYAAQRDGTWYWLIQIEDTEWEPQVRAAQVTRFEAHGGNWVALPMSGTTIVNLASWVDKLELAYIGWRWAMLARTIGYVHDKQVVMQGTRPLSLARLVFNSEGELIVAQTDAPGDEEFEFRAPDSPKELSSASDVFALGAALKTLAGENLPRKVENVLARATNVEARKRFANAKDFGEALAEALPDPKREKIVLPRKRSPLRLVAMTGLLSCGVCVLCIVLVIALGLVQNPLPSPTVVAEREIPLRVTILDWAVQGQCDGRVRVRAEEGEYVVTTNEGVQFFATTPQATITEIKLAPAQNPGEYVLEFGLGNFCETGGALTIFARRESKQGQSTVYYYPQTHAPENFVLYKFGGGQANVNAYPRMRLYFGLMRGGGEPASLSGPMIVKVYQDGESVNNFRLSPVDVRIDPLIAVLVIDTSKSMVGEPLERAKEAAVNFIQQLDPHDFVCVYRFSTQVEQAHVCGADHKSAINAVNKLQAGGNTALYDVLVRVGGLHAGKSERQAILLLSDGADNNSRATRDQAISEIQRSNVPVYAIALVNQDLAPQVLQDIAAKSGGTYLEAPTPNDLIGLYDVLGRRLTRQYQLDFESIFPERKRGTIEVVITDGKDEIRMQRDFVVEP